MPLLITTPLITVSAITFLLLIIIIIVVIITIIPIMIFRFVLIIIQNFLLIVIIVITIIINQIIVNIIRPCGLRRRHWLQAVSHLCLGSNPGLGMWESCQWHGVRRWFFAGYSGFLHYLQLASHELAIIGINVTKNKIPIPIVNIINAIIITYQCHHFKCNHVLHNITNILDFTLIEKDYLLRWPNTSRFETSRSTWTC